MHAVACCCRPFRAEVMCNTIEAGLVTAEGMIQFRSTSGSERQGLSGVHRHPLASVCVARMRVVGRMRLCSYPDPRADEHRRARSHAAKPLQAVARAQSSFVGGRDCDVDGRQRPLVCAPDCHLGPGDDANSASARHSEGRQSSQVKFV